MESALLPAQLQMTVTGTGTQPTTQQLAVAERGVQDLSIISRVGHQGLAEIGNLRGGATIRRDAFLLLFASPPQYPMGSDGGRCRLSKGFGFESAPRTGLPTKKVA